MSTLRAALAMLLVTAFSLSAEEYRPLRAAHLPRRAFFRWAGLVLKSLQDADASSLTVAVWLTRSANSLLGLNTVTRLAEIVIGSPVLGLRPWRCFLSLT